MDLIKLFESYGLIGLIVGVLFFENWFLIRKIVSVIESNTKAMIELKDHCIKKE